MSKRLCLAASFIAVVFAGCRHETRAVPEHVTELSTTETVVTNPPGDENIPVCPSGTVLVDGLYCPNVEETCLQWVDAKGDPTEAPDPGKTGRCGKWKYPTRCLSERKIRKRFCIDVYEYPNTKGTRPQSWMSWFDVKKGCESQKKRLCTRSEWTFACEGPDMQPYPYHGPGFSGYERDRVSCNTDNPMPKEINDILKVTQQSSVEGKILDGLLLPAGSRGACVSPFGVFDMVGNIDEFVVNESGQPYASGLMSGHVFGVRNACRPMTEAHGPGFSWYETGGRCCFSLTNQ